jgi:hypothetical protein
MMHKLFAAFLLGAVVMLAVSTVSETIASVPTHYLIDCATGEDMTQDHSAALATFSVNYEGQYVVSIECVSPK